MKAPTRPGPRERLLRAASELTYTHGVAVGLDAILIEADVARRSLYQHFGGKDQLIAEVLRTSAESDLQRYRDVMATAGDDPRARLLAVFDALDETTSADYFHGCRYTAADLALVDPDHPGRVQSRAYREHLREILEEELADLGHADPPGASRRLVMLIDGVLVAAINGPQTHPARDARRLAELVIDGN